MLPGSSRSGGGTDSNSDSDSNQGSSSSSTPTAAIAGGVVGGLAGLALISLALWFFLRRRRRRQDKPAELEGEGKDKSTLKPPQIAGTPIQEADSRSPGTVSALSPTASELPSTSSRYELATDANAPTTQMRTELPG